MSGRELVVDPEHAGERLDQFLAGPLGSRARAQRLIDAGRVTVDGAARPKRHRLGRGELVAVHEESEHQDPGRATPAAGIPIVYEDDALIVVDKPAGLVVHPARGHRAGTLAQLLAGRARGGADPDRAGIVHRLDRDTSGLLIVARSETAHRRLQDALGRRRIAREYVALVEGRPPARTGTIDAPIGRDRRDRTRISTDTDRPRPALTRFALERALPAASLLRVSLQTGRTHQIRVHLAAIGHPVCGDSVYGRAGVLGLERQFLHAERLAFEHPISGEALELTSPLPEDLREALARAQTAASL